MTRNNTLRTALLTLGVGTLTALAATSVSAQEIRFAYRQYELQTPDGTKNVHKRLMRHVGAVCRNWGTISLGEAMSRRACVADLSGQVVDKIGNPKLAAIHRSEVAETRFASRQ